MSSIPVRSDPSLGEDLLGLPFPRLAARLDELGVGARHAGRVFCGLHRDRLRLHDIPDLGHHANTLAAASSLATAEIVEVRRNDDETEKLLVRLADGAYVESVLVPMRADRYTLCVSTQVGCGMGCRFCATGTLGLTRQLTAGEIVAQVHAARALVGHRARHLTRLVYMGMGEPLHNYDALLDSLAILRDPHGPSFSSRRLLVSTVGLLGPLRRLAIDTGGRVPLALSLHAGTDTTRQRLIPTARRAPLAELRRALLDWPLPGSRKLMLEVVVLAGVNDGPEELDGIAAFAEGLPAVVNLIPFNPFPGAPFTPPNDAQVLAMQLALQSRGTKANVRWPRGHSVSGACGQLRLARPMSQ